VATSKKVCFLINPKSGTGNWKGVEEEIEKYLDKSFTKTILYTERPGHATELAAEAAKTFDIIIAVGGDGMMNETAKGMMGSSARLGIIPTGSGNALARHLGIPMDHKEAVECINHAHYETMDTALLNGTPFFAVAGTGFDAEIATKFADSIKRGFWTYFKLSLVNFFKYKSATYYITIDGRKYNQKAFLISVANSSQYGNNAFIAPEASVQSGTLEVCILKPFPWVIGIVLAYRLFSKSIHRSPFMETITGKKIEIHRADDKPLSIHYDGEVLPESSSMKIEVEPMTLRVILPRGREI